MTGYIPYTLAVCFLLASLYFIFLSVMKSIKMIKKTESEFYTIVNTATREGRVRAKYPQLMKVIDLVTSTKARSVVTRVSVLAAVFSLGYASGVMSNAEAMTTEDISATKAELATLRAEEIRRQQSIDWMYNIHVLGYLGAGRYLIEELDSGHPRNCPLNSPCTIKFVSEYIPEFETDSVIEWIKYIPTPSGWDVKDHDLGFKVRRDKTGEPLRFAQLKQ
jgi:hypothetical protein